MSDATTHERERDAAGGGTAARLTRTAMTYAELVRLPNCVTAPPDVLLGAALAAMYADSVSLPSVVGLAIASMVLYAGGTTLNDAFDAPIDARERPERPIPSGRVERRTAYALGVALLVLGVAIAALAAGSAGGLLAGLVALAIAGYDGVAKHTPAGSPTMGATRGLNVVLGTAAAGAAVLEFPRYALAVPAVIAVYITFVTHMAAAETQGGNPRAVALAGDGAALAVVALGFLLLAVRPPALETALAVVLAGAFLVWVVRPLTAAYRDPSPDRVGPAVGACVLGLVFLDAAFAAAVGIGWGLAALAFLLPAVGLARAFDVT